MFDSHELMFMNGMTRITANTTRTNSSPHYIIPDFPPSRFFQILPGYHGRAAGSAGGRLERVTMATFAQWVSGARPQTLPAALAPVAAGTGAAAALGGADPLRALLALTVALALQIGVNYANDYSDGIRGTTATGSAPSASPDPWRPAQAPSWPRPAPPSPWRPWPDAA